MNKEFLQTLHKEADRIDSLSFTLRSDAKALGQVGLTALADRLDEAAQTLQEAIHRLLASYNQSLNESIRRHDESMGLVLKETFKKEKS